VWTQLKGQIYLGSEAFVKKMQAQIEKRPSLNEIPRAQRRVPAQPLTKFEQRYERTVAMARAYMSGQHPTPWRPLRSILACIIRR
jgi:hypothetical protein